MVELRRASPDGRVLLLTPTSKDATVARALFAAAGIDCVICKDLKEVCSRIEAGAGAAIVPEEAILNDREGCLAGVLVRQPTWSDFPLIVLAARREPSARMAPALEFAARMTLVHRPIEMRSLLSTIRTALRDRERQYETRDNLREREQLLAEAQRAKLEAEAANQMKDDFLATLSHELRTPLNAILGWAKVLRMGQFDVADMDEGLAAIERNSVAQAQIIEDLLDISRIVSGHFRLDIQRVNLRDVIDSAVDAVSPAASARNIRVHKVLDPGAGPVSGDAARIQQVVWNLLSNAVKFTPNGGVVRVILDRDDSHAKISVIDDGMGIKPEFLPYVFDRFRQADSSTTRRHGGLGLGLAIVRQLVEIHGGSVRAESDGEGRGATFTVTLPIVEVHPERSDNPRTKLDSRSEFESADGDLDGVRVLVVDDEPDARRLLERVLADHGADVAVASSVPEALELVDSFRPHVLVSDIGMPEQDGYDLVRKIRVQGKTSADLPAAALTAFARSADRKRAMMAGFQTHVAKPVDPAELLAVVASFAGRTGTPK